MFGDATGAFGTTSPDGLGDAYAPAPLAGKIDFIEPEDTSPQAAVRSAGFTALTVAVAFGTGLALGGPWGGLSGILLSGSAFNGYRAQKWWGSADPSEKHEAVVSALFAAVGVASGGYTAYKAFQAKDR